MTDGLKQRIEKRGTWKGVFIELNKTIAKLRKLRDECEIMGKDLYVKGCRDGLNEALKALDSEEVD